MSSRPESTVHTTGAHRAHRVDRADRGAPRSEAAEGPAPEPGPPRDEAQWDGLFTYCLSVLCDHEAATAALRDALAFAERRGSRGPQDGDRRAWLYALARWSCLRQLSGARHAESRHRDGGRATGAHTGADRRARGHTAAPGHTYGTATADRHRTPAEPHRPDWATRPAATAPRPDREAAEQNEQQEQADREGPAEREALEREQRRQLALLAWPEAAGTTPEQREALELAVRHRLAAREVAAVVGIEVAAARDLIASAACEVERTRAALAVVESGGCPIVARLTGDHQLLLGATLRRELVRHVDDCPRCRRTAERCAAGAWPGTSLTPSALPLLPAPRAALGPAAGRGARGRGGPRYDRRGFPMDPRDHAARRDRIRARAVTTTVVATVVAAPVLALWAAYRGAPIIGEGTDGRSVTASRSDGNRSLDSGRDGDRYENAGNASRTPDPRFSPGDRRHDVSVEVISPGGASHAPDGQGRLTVTARPAGGATVITLSAAGGPVRWRARTGAPWLYLSSTSGTLRAGGTQTVHVYVDRGRQPAGPWSARITLEPSGAVVRVDGHGRGRPSGYPRPTPSRTVPGTPGTPSPPGSPEPTPSGSTSPTPTPTGPGSPEPTPTPTGSTPGPGDSDPPPGGGTGTPAPGPS
ncbi:hypothetical protein [Streptomyces sp. NPDC058045]|uniref:hypothetical protein n=1 Tax=Streptomyces sp. NPDC058045 TaxID=3346311 RepID=UPI0036E95AA4